MEDIVESNDPMQSGKVVEENDMAELVAEAENQALKRDCEFDAKSPSKKQKTDDCSPEESAPVDNALLENAGKVGKENPPQHMSKNARESRKYPAVKVYSVFEDLQIRSRKLEEEGEENSWTLCDYNDDLKYAVFSWLDNAVALMVVVDEKMEPKRSRKSELRLVSHYTIKSLHLTGVRESFEDPVLDTAIHILLRKFPSVDLLLQCPNTHSLMAFLKKISDLVPQSVLLYSSLLHVTRTNLVHLQDNVIKIEFGSGALKCSFSVVVSYAEGISSAIQTLRLESQPGNMYDLTPVKKIIGSVEKSPTHIETLCDTVWKYITDKESKL